MGWSARRVGRKYNHANSASFHVPCGRSANSPRGAVCAGRVKQRSNTVAVPVQSRSRRPGAESVRRGLGQRCGVERVPRRPLRQQRQVRQRARAPWSVGRLSTGGSARGEHGAGFGSYSHEYSKPQPPTWRGVGEEEPRPTLWGEARPALAAKTTTPSPPASACSVGGRPVLHGAKRAGGARHGIRKLWLRKLETAAADLARYR